MLELRVLGSLDLTRDDGVAVSSVLAQPKRTALLAYLAVAEEPGEFHRRDTLLATFWPERDEAHARNALNQSLHFLRRSLGPDTIRGRGREEVGVDGDALWCDAAAFRDALERGEEERAVELYRGDFLEGFHLSDALPFDRWADRRRSRLRSRAREAALGLAGGAADTAQARRWLERALQVAPTDEDVARRLMELLDGAGDRAGALRAYEVLSTRLERSLGVEPSPETRALAEGIRGRKRRYRTGSPTPVPAGPPSAGDLAVEAAEEASPAETPATPEPEGDSEPAGSPRRWSFYVGTLAILAASGLLLSGIAPDLAPFAGGGTAADATDDGPGASDPRTVAVLPFDDLSGSPTGSHFGEGLAEEILHRLASSPDLRVVARTSSFRFGGARLDVRSLGDSLGAGTVLEGTVRRSGDRMRVTAQLVDAGDGLDLWSGSYDVRMTTGQLFDLQETIAGAIADTLRVRLAADGGGSASRLPTDDLEAYSLYLRGRRAWNDRTPESFRRAVRLYEAALARDPAFARAWAGLAELYVLIPSFPNVSSLMPDFVSREEAGRRAREAVERALALDEGLAQAHAALGQLLRGEDGDRAEEELRRAIALDPSYSTARQWLAFLLATRGRLGRALEQMRTAHHLDPFSVSINGDLGRFLYYAEEHGEAIQRLRRTLDLGAYPQAEEFLALALSAAGRHEEATRRARALDPDDHGETRVQAVRSVVAARAGREAEARDLLTRWKGELGPVPSSGWASDGERGDVLRVAWLHAALDEPDTARAWLARVERPGPGNWLMIRNEPLLAAVRQDAADRR